MGPGDRVAWGSHTGHVDRVVGERLAIRLGGGRVVLVDASEVQALGSKRQTGPRRRYTRRAQPGWVQR